MNAETHNRLPELPERAVAMRQGSAARITRSLLGHVNAIAEDCGAAAVFVYVDALEGQTLPLDEEIGPKAYYLTKTVAEEEEQEARGTNFIRVPNVPLTRMAQLKVAVFLALSHGIVKHGDVIVCLTGMPETGSLDTILVTEVGREFEMFSSDKETEQVPADIRPEVIERVVNIASELGNEGREGKPVGAMFVVGDSERVRSLSRQLIINRFRGYEEHERNILDPALEETVKELSTLDGAFIVRGGGVIESRAAATSLSARRRTRPDVAKGDTVAAAARPVVVDDDRRPKPVPGHQVVRGRGAAVYQDGGRAVRKLGVGRDDHAMPTGAGLWTSSEPSIIPTAGRSASARRLWRDCRTCWATRFPLACTCRFASVRRTWPTDASGFSPKIRSTMAGTSTCCWATSHGAGSTCPSSGGRSMSIVALLLHESPTTLSEPSDLQCPCQTDGPRPLAGASTAPPRRFRN